MNPNLKATLHKAIETWIEDHCEDREWEALDVVFGRRLAECMTDGAAAVFDGIVDSQGYAVAEGYLKEAAPM